MKPFDIELAKAGHPVQTRDGKPARIVCYDRKSISPIVALILEEDDIEHPYPYYIDGMRYSNGICNDDLFMASTKKEGWINIYPEEKYVRHISNAYATEGEALEKRGSDCLATIKIEWEE